jgi:hypothetical protein
MPATKKKKSRKKVGMAARKPTLTSAQGSAKKSARTKAPPNGAQRPLQEEVQAALSRTPHAWAKVAQWSDKRDEFVKRAAFALLASLAGHDKSASDERFVESLRFVERASSDERNFVKKGVSWALRRIGRRNAALNAAAVTVARRLSVSPEAAARWVGRGALKELTSPAVVRQLAARRKATGRSR